MCLQAQLLELRAQNYKLSDDLRKNTAGKTLFQMMSEFLSDIYFKKFQISVYVGNLTTATIA